ncbi:MAG: vitamin K epoxide reductase family protein [Acidimicrobiia bacterium]|nr:vitamin K epoxide reductase family protein [Acidimicrobiia bacterium]
MNKRGRLLVLVLVLLALSILGPAASGQTAVVRAVLFFSPSCGHCEYVINDLLFPVWFPQYGGEAEVRFDSSLAQPTFFLGTNGTLEVLFVDVSTQDGAEMFYASADVLGIPDSQLGVPRLVVGNTYLIGSGDIPAEFPGIIETGLASGGIDWPDFPGMTDALAGIPETMPTTTTTAVTSTTNPDSTTSPSSTTTSDGATTTTDGGTTTTSGGGVLPGGNDSPWDRFQRDATANSIALVVLILMVLSLGGVVWFARRGEGGDGPGIAVPLLALVGLGVAIYLAFVETSGTEAVCGPVGDCNTVQQSEWAKVFGVIPVGLIGVGGYVVVLGAWALARFGPARLGDWARVALLAGSVSGVAFSIYLTFLEPFVIGATCMWCLGSAVVVTLLMWLTARPGLAAGRRLLAGRVASRRAGAKPQARPASSGARKARPAPARSGAKGRGRRPASARSSDEDGVVRVSD